MPSHDAHLAVKLSKYCIYFATGFLSTPSNTAPTTDPTNKEIIYINGFPTTGNTKIPPCGAIKVHWNAMDNAPETAEPMTQDGIT